MTQNRKVFLAGATGLAGSSIMMALLAQDSKVVIRAAYHRVRPFIKHRRVTYVRVDLRSSRGCAKAVAGCDAAVLAAAHTSGVRETVLEPWRQVTDNAIINARLLEACYRRKVRRVVCVGSATLYQPREGAIKEEDLDLNQDPDPAYAGIGWVTRFTEKLCQFWHQSAGLQIVMVRAANIFGPHDKFNPAVSHFVPALIRKAVERQDPFEVWGGPEVRRDVIYGEDFARAVVAMLLHEGVKFDVFNIGSGVGTTVGEVVGWVLKYSRHEPLRIAYNADRPTTHAWRMLDCSKVRRVLGWQPVYSVEEGIRQTVAWWKKNRRWWRR